MSRKCDTDIYRGHFSHSEKLKGVNEPTLWALTISIEASAGERHLPPADSTHHTTGINFFNLAFL